MTITIRNATQDGMKFHHPCQRCHPMISWKVCTNLRIRESNQLKTVLELYDMEIHQKISVPNYQKLKTTVKRSIDQKLRLRNFDARHGRIETGAEVKNRKGIGGVEGGKGTLVSSGKKKDQCSKGDQCSFPHEGSDRAQKPDRNAATHSEPPLSRGRSVSRKRSIRGKSNHGAILRQPCRYHLKGTCTRSPREYWRLQKQKRDVKLGISVCSRIIRLMNNQKKRQNKGYYSHKARENDDKNAVAIVKIVPQLGCVSQDSDALVSLRDKQSRENVTQVSGKRKDHRLEKYKSNILISEVPTL